MRQKWRISGANTLTGITVYSQEEFDNCPSAKTFLFALHSKFPNWIFVATESENIVGAKIVVDILSWL